MSRFSLTYIPNERLKNIHSITIGAKVLAILLVPNGWMAKTRPRIAHDTPTTVDEEIFGFTTVILERLSLCGWE
jgi:hypothetical protein